jgi:hypothetical protein
VQVNGLGSLQLVPDDDAVGQLVHQSFVVRWSQLPTASTLRMPRARAART